MVKSAEKKLPFVSVIIPVYNDAKRLSLCLNALNNQTYPKSRYEIVVVDDGSTVRVHGFLLQGFRGLNRFRIIRQENKGPDAARNIGILNSKGKILAFTDSDCTPDSNWIWEGVKALLGAENAGLVGGKVLMFSDNKKIKTVEFYDLYLYLDQIINMRYHHFAATANMLAFRKLFDDIGLFNQDLYMAGDIDWGQRVHKKGYNLFYAERAVVKHPATDSLTRLMAKERRISIGTYLLDKKKDNIKSLYQFFILATRKLLGSFNLRTTRKIRSSSLKLNLIFLKLLMAFIFCYSYYKMIMRENKK
jgi:glycosyltransferase involved in cell wall biosynthesis